jgi:hypothetical protein
MQFGWLSFAHFAFRETLPSIGSSSCMCFHYLLFAALYFQLMDIYISIHSHIGDATVSGGIGAVSSER